MLEEICLTQLAYCIAGVLLFLLGSGWIKIDLFTKFRRYFLPIQHQINDLRLEIQQHQAELAKIPIMDQFAANRKKQRVIDKLLDNLTELTQKRDKQEMASGFAWTLFGKGLCLSLGIYLASQSSDLVVSAISSSNFYPFNYLLAYPAITSKSTETNVSLFSFFILTFFAGKIFCKRVLIFRASNRLPVHPELD